MIRLVIDGEVIWTTPEHPFYLGNGQWIHAGDLQDGDLIRNANWQLGQVQDVTTIYQTRTMYNLSVDTAHTYVVGQQQWLVHNTSLCPDKIHIPGPVNSPYGKLDYLLGNVPGNQNSLGKGQFFEGVLGFDNNSLGDALERHLIDNFDNATTYTRSVDTLSVTGEIVGANGRTANVKTVWEILPNGEYRFITAHPEG